MEIVVKDILAMIPIDQSQLVQIEWLQRHLLEKAEAIKHANENKETIEFIFTQDIKIAGQETNSICFKPVTINAILDIVALSEVYNINTNPFVRTSDAHEQLKQSNKLLIERFWDVNIQAFFTINGGRVDLLKDIQILLMLSKMLLDVFSVIIHRANYEAEHATDEPDQPDTD